jgi:hypothetical protein
VTVYGNDRWVRAVMIIVAMVVVLGLVLSSIHWGL